MNSLKRQKIMREIILLDLKIERRKAQNFSGDAIITPYREYQKKIQKSVGAAQKEIAKIKLKG